MPKGSKVARCVDDVMADGKSKVAGIRICQASTGDSYRTGKKSKNENTMNNIYDRTLNLVRKSVRTSILEKDVRAASKTLGQVFTGTARMGMGAAKASAGQGGLVGRHGQSTRAPGAKTWIPSAGELKAGRVARGAGKDADQDNRTAADKMQSSKDREISQMPQRGSGPGIGAHDDKGKGVAPDEPQKEKGSNFWNRTKTAARVAGLTPGPIGFAADAAAAGITGIQRVFAKTPERKAQLNWELAGDAAAMVPVAGQAARLATTSGKKILNKAAQKTAEKLAPKASAAWSAKVAQRRVATEAAKKAAAEKATKEAAEKATRHAARPRVVRKTIDAVKGAKRKIGQASKFGRKVAGKGMRRLTLGASMLGDRGDSNQDDNKRGTSKRSYPGGDDSRKKKRSSGMEDPKKLSRIKRGTR